MTRRNFLEVSLVSILVPTMFQDKIKYPEITDIKELESILYKNANNSVGKVGESTNNMYSIIGQEYIEVAWSIDKLKDILPMWDIFIISYMNYAKYMFDGNVNSFDNPLCIYWRKKPEIIKQHDRTGFLVYARLLIAKFNSYYVERYKWTKN